MADPVIPKAIWDLDPKYGELVLTVEEVASILRVSPDTVLNLYRVKRLRAVLIGRHLRWLPQHIREFVQALKCADERDGISMRSAMQANNNGSRAKQEDSKNDRPCILYVVRDNSRKTVKVGITYNSEKRLLELECGCGSILIPVRTEHYPTRRAAHAAEQSEHTRWHSRRLKGEWFDDHDGIVSAYYSDADKDDG